MISLELSKSLPIDQEAASPAATAPASESPAERTSAADLLALLRDAIGFTREYALPACPPAAARYSGRLVRLEDQLTVTDLLVPIAPLRQDLQTTLQEYAAASQQDYATRTEESRDLVRLMAEMARTVAIRSRASSSTLNDCAKRIEQVRQLDSVTAMRAALEEQVGRLRESIERDAREQQAMVVSLEKEIGVMRSRLQAAETAASLDTLTMLLNRRGFAVQFDSRMREGGSPFTLIVLDLNHFKGINDRYGHLVGDAALREFATRLKNAVRPTDIACRWGGDEFLVLLDCPLRDGLPRSRQIQQAVSGRYRLPGPGGEVMVPVGAAIGVAEAGPEDTLQSLIERADVQLYRRKKQAGPD